MKVFVAGATGQTGRRIVSELVKRQIAVRALVRNLELAQQVLPKEAELVVGDVLDKASIAIADCDVIICATGAKPSFNFTAPLLVDYVGTNNLVNIAKTNGVKQFVLVSSLCVSRLFHPLNLFWLILFWKKQAENHLKASGVTYTIVRPGGLKNQDAIGGVVLGKADTLFEGSIPRSKVAEVCVDSLFCEQAQNQILEIVSTSDTPVQSLEKW
ncbi:NmrA-like family protein [Synechococcus sp. PCC 7502]|uniref:SDR family oxidoreductase n=1 Tax=Synechococcus sp. PCC 7502 TaxID=1173263 RepID=UPI00029FACE7|nr:SDR family oxidoreductase [Synechococcus sp. PCC 7502]AFY73470.1 NmrA-like family protein [Synechococcus sp. PCC 7502]